MSRWFDYSDSDDTDKDIDTSSDSDSSTESSSGKSSVCSIPKKWLKDRDDEDKDKDKDEDEHHKNNKKNNKKECDSDIWNDTYHKIYLRDKDYKCNRCSALLNRYEKIQYKTFENRNKTICKKCDNEMKRAYTFYNKSYDIKEIYNFLQSKDIIKFLKREYYLNIITKLFKLNIKCKIDISVLYEDLIYAILDKHLNAYINIIDMIDIYFYDLLLNTEPNSNTYDNILSFYQKLIHQMIHRFTMYIGKIEHNDSCKVCKKEFQNDRIVYVRNKKYKCVCNTCYKVMKETSQNIYINYDKLLLIEQRTLNTKILSYPDIETYDNNDDDHHHIKLLLMYNNIDNCTNINFIERYLGVVECHTLKLNYLIKNIQAKIAIQYFTRGIEYESYKILRLLFNTNDIYYDLGYIPPNLMMPFHKHISIQDLKEIYLILSLKYNDKLRSMYYTKVLYDFNKFGYYKLDSVEGIIYKIKYLLSKDKKDDVYRLLTRFNTYNKYREIYLKILE